MAAAMDILFILTIAAALAFAAAFFLRFLADALTPAWSGIWKGISEGLSSWEARASANDRRARVEAQLSNRMGVRKQGRDVDSNYVQASETTKRISAALGLTKDATKTCCDIQKFKGQVCGATNMQDLQEDSLCVNLRQYVLDSIDVALETLESYPSMERKVLKQYVSLGAMRERCVDCELLKYSVANAPQLCSPAKSMGNRRGDRD